ncbi:MAG: hypothetical protein LC737_00725 [Chloroflexi bacterium]|nr:hypothetical protein [Chloroflexota bacterium]
MNVFDVLVCPRCAQPLRVSARRDASGDVLPASGFAVCDACESRFPIRDHVLDLAPPGGRLTLAGWSNNLPLAPRLYERAWRPRSLSILTHGEFCVRGELALLNEWLPLRADEVVVDLGTSTGLYARAVQADAQRADGDRRGYVARHVARCA